MLHLGKKPLLLNFFISGMIIASQYNMPVCQARHDLLIEQNLKTRKFGLLVLQCPRTGQLGNRLLVYSRTTAEPVLDREYPFSIKMLSTDDNTILAVTLANNQVCYEALS